MPVPKRKRSRARRDKRFANKGIKAKSITACSNCSDPLTTHTACKTCGHYKGRKLFATKADRAVKRVETRQAKQASQAKKQEESSDE